MDTIIGADQKGAILTITDRKTDFAIIEPDMGRMLKITQAQRKRLAFPQKKRTNTLSDLFDNRSEFAH